MRELFVECLDCGGKESVTARLSKLLDDFEVIDCHCYGGKELVEVEQTIDWCFAHQREQFWPDDDEPGCIHLGSDRSACDIGLGAVVRVEDPDAK